MTVQQELHPATFKNVPFLVTQSNTSGGRKTITHEFVNSNERNVEDLGLLQKTFSITAIITGPNYTQKKDALIRVLEEGGRGPLVHPFFGRLNVVAKPYSLVETMTELGEAKFSLVFERSEDNPQPQPGGSTIQTVGSSADGLFNSLEDDVADSFTVSNKFPRNFKDAETTMENIGLVFQSATSRVRNNVQGLNEFNSTVVDFNDDFRSLIASPQELGLAIGNLFTTMRDIATTPVEFLDILSNFYDFGDDDTPIILTTEERIERQDNRTIINNLIKVGSLADSYRFVVTVDFDTVDNIDEAQEILDNQYSATVDDLPTDTQIVLNELRNQARDFLDEQRISAKRVIEIETKRIPAQVLTYSLYGNVDDTEKIIELNTVKDVSFVEGEVQVLT